jgi:uncharacterized protein YkwD
MAQEVKPMRNFDTIDFRKWASVIVAALVVAWGTPATAQATDDYAGRLGVLINEYRGRHGLAPLVAEDSLASLARQHSADMAKAGSLSHDGYETRFRDSGHAMCVENVGWNYPTPAKQMAAWEASPGHERNMSDARVTHMGVGVAANYVTFIACR